MSRNGGQDGMDGILICMNTLTKEITYAASNNAPLIIRNKEIIELDTDKMPIGSGIRQDSFSLFKIDYLKDDILYL